MSRNFQLYKIRSWLLHSRLFSHLFSTLEDAVRRICYWFKRPVYEGFYFRNRPEEHEEYIKLELIEFFKQSLREVHNWAWWAFKKHRATDPNSKPPLDDDGTQPFYPSVSLSTWEQNIGSGDMLHDIFQTPSLLGVFVIKYQQESFYQRRALEEHLPSQRRIF